MDDFDKYLSDTLLTDTGTTPAMPAPKAPEPAAPASIPPPAVSSGDPIIDFLTNVEYETGEIDNVGFWPSLKTGAQSLYNSAVQIPAMKLAQGFEAIVREFNPELADQIAADDEGFFRGSKGEMKDVLAMSKKISSAPTSQTLQALGKADDWDTFFNTFMDSEEKWTVVKEVLGLSLPTSLGVAGGAYFNGLKGAFSGSFMADWGNSYMESLKAGKSEGEALFDGTVKAMTQAGIDTATLKASSIIDTGSKLKDILAQSTIQSLGGGGAEWAKHVAVGEDTTVGQIGIEAFSEFALGPLEVLGKSQGEKKRAAANEIRELFEKHIRLDPKEALVAQARLTLDELDKRLADLPEQKLLGPDSIEETMLTPRKVRSMEVEFLQSATEEQRKLWADLQPLEGLTLDVAGEAISLPNVPLEAGKAYYGSDLIRLQEKIDVFNQSVEQQQAALDTLMLDPMATQEMIEERQAALDDSKQELDYVKKLHEDTSLVMRRAKSFVEDLNARFGIEQSVLITTGALNKESQDWFDPMPLFEETNYGAFISPLSGANAWVLAVNMDEMFRSDGVFTGKGIETIAHEYGHMLTLQKYHQLTADERKAVMNSYRKWIKDIATKKLSLDEHLKLTRGIASGEQILGWYPEADHIPALEVILRSDPDYDLGLTEFLAHQFEKLATEPSAVSHAVRKAFAGHLDDLQALHSEFKDQYGNAQQDFKLFLKRHMQFVRVSNLERELSEAQLRRLDTFAAENAGGNIKKIIRKAMGKDYEGDHEGSLDQYNVLYNYMGGLTHLAQDNPHIQGLQEYTGEVKGWWNEKMEWTSSADEVLKAWNSYVGVFNKQRKGDRFGKFLLDLTVKSFDSEKRYTPTSKEFIELVNQHGIDEQGLALYDLIDRQFKKALDALEEGITAHIRKTYKENQFEAEEQIQKLAADMSRLRDRNFFPLTRYGKHYIHIQAARDVEIDGVQYKLGDTISFTTFEKKKLATKQFHKERSKKDVKVQQGQLSDFQKSFMGIPPEMLGVLVERLELTEAQMAELKLFLTERAPGQSFKKHLLDRKQTAGFSLDAMRGFANYFMHFSNHIAKVKHNRLMDEAIGKVISTISFIQGDASRRQQIVDHLVRHKDYIMNPGNEMANLRSLGFLWYLGFVPKSAVVNLTQVPMVTYPYLAARYGDAEAVASLASAMRTFGKIFTNPEKVSVDMMQMLEELKKRGTIDESMATEMAATAEGSIINRFAPSFATNPRAQRMIRTGAGWGAWMFQHAEKANRRITALATYQLARKKGFGHEAAIDQADHAVTNTQYEYARWNRPFFTQKKRSIFFLFWMYKTNAMYFLMKDPGNTRYLMMLMFTAGLAGLPFADDIMDLHDWIAKKLNAQFGENTAPINSRLELQELIKELDLNPDLMMHGASRYMFGLPKLADLVGIPMSNADMSGSISMGRMIPGIHPIFGSSADYATRFTKGMEEAGGAVMAIPAGIIRAIADDNPNTLKRVEKALPSFARNFTKSYRFSEAGADVTNTGAELVKFDLHDPMHRSEVILQALGFPSTRAQVEKEKFWMTKEIVQYYTARRGMLMQDFDYVRRNGDFEGEQFIRQKIREFNQQVPVKAFAISGSDLSQSIKNREKSRRLIERGIFTPPKARALQQRIDAAFPQPSEEAPDDPTIILEEIVR